MGYITTVLTPEERRKAGPKNGAQATRDGRARSARLGDRARRLGAAGPGPSHGAGADRRRRVRAAAQRHSRRHRFRYRARTPGRSRRATIRAASPPPSPAPAHLAAMRLQRQARAHAPRRSSNVRPEDIELRRRRSRARAATRTTRMPVRTARGREPLVARRWCRQASSQASARRCSGRRRSCTAPDRGRRDQFLALPRLHLRFLRRRDRPRHRRGAHRPLCHHA